MTEYYCHVWRNAALFLISSLLLTSCIGRDSENTVQHDTLKSRLISANTQVNDFWKDKDWKSIYRLQQAAFEQNVTTSPGKYPYFLDLMSKAYGVGGFDTLKLVDYAISDSFAITVNYLVYSAKAPSSAGYHDFVRIDTSRNRWRYLNDTWYLMEWDIRDETEVELQFDTLDPFERRLKELSGVK